MPKRNTELAVEIGSRIAARRKELKWTQEEAAERAGLSHQFLACAERGIKGIGAESILKLCKAMDISADYLLAGCMTPAERDYLSQLLAPMSERQRDEVIEIIKHVLSACGYELPERAAAPAAQRGGGASADDKRGT